MTTVNGRKLCDSNLCPCGAQFLVYFDLGPNATKREPCSKHLARAVRETAKAGREATRSKAIVFVKPLGGAS